MSKTLTAAIKEDHEEMYEYYEKYKKASQEKNTDAAERWCRQMMWEIARHAVGEEIVVYPLMEKHLGERGMQLADQDRKDHIVVKKQLSELDTMIAEGKVGTAPFDILMFQCLDHLREHNDNEERDDLPLLEPAIGEEASLKAAKSFTLTKKFAPTRAHPNAPNRPPLETLAGFLLAPIDMLKDIFAKFPTEEMKAED